MTISFKSIVTYFVTNDYLTTNSNSITEYSDFVADWYVSIGYQILINCIILVFHPALTMPLFYCVMECLNKCKAQRQEVQAEMDKLL